MDRERSSLLTIVEKGLNHITFLDSISFNTDDKQSYLENNITFEDFVQYLIFDILVSLNKRTDGYYVAYKPISLPCISFIFIEMKFIHCYSCMMFVIKYVSICND